MPRDKRTALYSTHIRLGARIVSFGEWQMPVSYTGISHEHETVRTRVGLFDVSHMGQLRVIGQQALELVQFLTINNAAALANGQSQYSAFATEAGGFVDDLLVYRFNENDYLLVVNAANVNKDLNWVRDHNPTSAEVRDISEDTGMVALQGPRAEATLTGMGVPEASGLQPFQFAEVSVAGVTGTLSRTGYTGEDGFELSFPAPHSSTVWEALLEAGQPHGIVPAGLGARNTLRLEARLLLYGNDIDETTNAYEAGLGWMVQLDKGPFIGRDALRAARDRRPERRLVGFQMLGRQVARDAYPVFVDGTQVGRVTSGAPSVSLKKNIGLTYLPTSHVERHALLQVQIRERLCDAEQVATPFYKRRRPNEP